MSQDTRWLVIGMALAAVTSALAGLDAQPRIIEPRIGWMTRDHIGTTDDVICAARDVSVLNDTEEPDAIGAAGRFGRTIVACASPDSTRAACEPVISLIA